MEKIRMTAKRQAQGFDKIWSLLFQIILLSFYFIYLLLQINPRLIYQTQEPVFFFDRYFINGFFNYPGGINDLIAKFLSQFFYYPWTGAALLIVIFWLIARNTKLLLQYISPNLSTLYLHWIPSIFLLALHSNYRFPLVLTLGLLWILFSVNIYIRLAPTNKVVRLFFYIILNGLLCYVIAGQAFVFSITIILYEILYYRRLLLPLLYTLFAVLLPYIEVSTLFPLHIQNGYAGFLMAMNIYKVTWLFWLLCAFFPLAMLLQKLKQSYFDVRRRTTNNLPKKPFYRSSIPTHVYQGILFYALVIFAALGSYDKSGKIFLQVDYYARQGEWEKVLDIAEQHASTSHLPLYQVNRALYHCGRLCDDMFRFRQTDGVGGLFIDEKFRTYLPLQYSDVFFDLGLVNEAEHWAYEALAINGDTAWNLQRLVLVNLIKENRKVARKYLRMLQKTMWHRSWAKVYQNYLADGKNPTLVAQFAFLKSPMPKTDFLISSNAPERCLEEMLKNSRKNRMAFEYFMAYCLLDGKISQLVKYLYLLNDFGYPRIPRHCEEAILIFIQLTGIRDIVLPGKKISRETIEKFNDFNKIMAKYNKNKEAAYQELAQKYKDTYWFYAFYYYHPEEN
jgi:hypothetical protein